MKTLSLSFCVRGFWILLLICANPAMADAPLSTTEKTKTCFQCNGTGKMKCAVCNGTGKADCPGQCLKLTKGSWIHMEVAGHPATDVWQKFATPAGGWRAYNQNHAGHVI